MSKKQFTPGPWVVESRTTTNENGVTGLDINQCQTNETSGRIVEGLATIWGEKTGMDVEGSANARLIAAAPSMFELLEAVLPYLKAKGTNGNHHVEKIDSLLNSITNG